MTSPQQTKILQLQTRIEELEAMLDPDAELGEKIARIKAVQYRVAMKFKKENRWCAEYDRLLQAAGVVPFTRQLNLSVMVPVSMTVEVDAGMFNRLSEEEKAEFLQGRLQVLDRQFVGDESVQIVNQQLVDGAQVVGIEVPDAPLPTPAGRIRLPDGYTLRYTSELGRSAHILDPYATSRMEDGRYSSPMCGRMRTISWSTNPAAPTLEPDGNPRITT
jgi:hypothetical protein